MQLAQFLIFFQKSGSYVKLRTRTIHFRGENTAGGTVTGGNFAIEVGIFFPADCKYGNQFQNRSHVRCCAQADPGSR